MKCHYRASQSGANIFNKAIEMWPSRLGVHIWAKEGKDTLNRFYQSTGSITQKRPLCLVLLIASFAHQMPTVLILLDLGSSFDVIDHHTLITRLSSPFGIAGIPISFLASYLSNHNQCVRSGNVNSCTSNCHTHIRVPGEPQQDSHRVLS